MSKGEGRTGERVEGGGQGRSNGRKLENSRNFLIITFDTKEVSQHNHDDSPFDLPK